MIWLPLILTVSVLFVARIWLPNSSRTGSCEKYYGVTCQSSGEDRKLMQLCPSSGK
jgi:hypothetical protein